MTTVLTSAAISSVTRPMVSGTPGSLNPAARAGGSVWAAAVGVAVGRGEVTTAGSGLTRCPTGLTFRSMAKPQSSRRAA